MKVSVEYGFDGAHYLPCYDGKCQNQHGHTWKVRVVAIGSISEIGKITEGMLIDFTYLKQHRDRFDHQLLNSLNDTPTAENIALLILHDLKKSYGWLDFEVKVWESIYPSESFVEVNSKEDF